MTDKIDKVSNILRVRTDTRGLAFSRIAEEIDALYADKNIVPDESGYKVSGFEPKNPHQPTLKDELTLEEVTENLRFKYWQEGADTMKPQLEVLSAEKAQKQLCIDDLKRQLVDLEAENARLRKDHAKELEEFQTRLDNTEYDLKEKIAALEAQLKECPVDEDEIKREIEDGDTGCCLLGKSAFIEGDISNVPKFEDCPSKIDSTSSDLLLTDDFNLEKWFDFFFALNHRRPDIGEKNAIKFLLDNRIAHCQPIIEARERATSQARVEGIFREIDKHAVILDSLWYRDLKKREGIQ